jgi:hypothetical protein
LKIILKFTLIIAFILLCSVNIFSQVKVNLENGGIYNGIVVRDEKDTLFISDVRNYILKSPSNILIAISKKKYLANNSSNSYH